MLHAQYIHENQQIFNLLFGFITRCDIL